MTDSDTSFLALDGITKAIGRRLILKDISFRFEEGKRYLLMGPNGSGKTTLLKIISCLMRTTQGAVYYRGQEIGSIEEAYLRRISFLSHQINMYEELTGLQNLEFFSRLYDVEDYKDRAPELLDLLGLRFFMNDRVKNYSQGMKQRLAVAKAVISSPKILLFDEPFVGLDLRGVDLLQEMIAKTMSGEGMDLRLLVLSTHDSDLGWQLADQYLYIERGQIISCGDREKFVQEGIVERLRRRKDVGVY